MTVEIDDELLTRFRPDVHVSERSPGSGGILIHETAPSVATIEAAEPTLVAIGDEPPTARSVSIIDRAGGRVITSIEFLSPHNKLTPRAREVFRRKQELLLAGGVNLVEVDLIRQGSWVLSVREPSIRQSWSYPYRVCVVRAEFPSRAECYDLPLRQRLPVIRIPLRPEDRDVTLDLQRLIDAAWSDGGYAGTNYERLPLPPFEPDDLEWIRECIDHARPQAVSSNA